MVCSPQITARQSFAAGLGVLQPSAYRFGQVLAEGAHKFKIALIPAVTSHDLHRKMYQ